jgi:hypothetical protein
VTRIELEVAQHLLHVFTRAEALADRIDPERRREGPIVAALDSLARTSGEAFHALTGRSAARVSPVELNADRPAIWTLGVGGPR